MATVAKRVSPVSVVKLETKKQTPGASSPNKLKYELGGETENSSNVRTIVKSTRRPHSSEKKQHSIEKLDVNERINALRARANTGYINQTSHLHKKSPSVEKIKIEAPLKDPEPKYLDLDLNKPSEYSRGRSRGHRRTNSISETKTSNKERRENNELKGIVSKANKQSQNKLSNKDDRQKSQPLKNSPYSYQAALNSSNKALFSKTQQTDKLQQSQNVKKVAIVPSKTKIGELSENKIHEHKRQVSQVVSKEKLEFKEKRKQNIELDIEVNKKKKLIVIYF